MGAKEVSRGYHGRRGRIVNLIAPHEEKTVGAKADSAWRQSRRDAAANDGSPNTKRHDGPGWRWA